MDGQEGVVLQFGHLPQVVHSERLEWTDQGVAGHLYARLGLAHAEEVLARTCWAAHLMKVLVYIVV